MKIIPHETMVDKVAGTRSAAASKRAQAPEPQPAGDRVSLSPRARELAAARRALEVIPDVRPDKVADLKARIEAGNYRIDSEVIADRMLRDALPDD
jgi:negative regulator of flagellin synthesis FlgM